MNESENKIFDVCIVGGGPAGIFTITQAGMLGMNACLIESTEELGGQCAHVYPEKFIYDMPAFKSIKASDLVLNLKDQAKKFNPTYFINESVISIKKNEKIFEINTKTKKIISKIVIIAIGKGGFEPNRPKIKNLELYENKSVFYNVTNQVLFKNKKVMIAGGGDSAADWSIQLFGSAEKIELVHRRESMRCLKSNFEKILDLDRNNQNFNFLHPYQIEELLGNDGVLKSVILKNFNTDELKKIEIDNLLLFFGMKSEVNYIEKWGLELSNDKKILVNRDTMMTNIEGIYSIGDISIHSAKMKLILSFFNESCIALHHAYEYVFNKKMIFEHSSSKDFSSII